MQCMDKEVRVKGLRLRVYKVQGEGLVFKVYGLGIKA